MLCRVVLYCVVFILCCIVDNVLYCMVGLVWFGLVWSSLFVCLFVCLFVVCEIKAVTLKDMYDRRVFLRCKVVLAKSEMFNDVFLNFRPVRNQPDALVVISMLPLLQCIVASSSILALFAIRSLFFVVRSQAQFVQSLFNQQAMDREATGLLEFVNPGLEQ